MNISQLQAKIFRLERELEGTRQQLAHATHGPTTCTAELVQSRAYSFLSKNPTILFSIDFKWSLKFISSKCSISAIKP